MKTSTVACLVFAKPPVPGLAKTRLAAVVGPVAAAELARAFLRDTWTAVRALDRDPVLLTTDPAADHGIEAERRDQGTGDLGARLERALRAALRDHDAAVALGGDSPGIPAGHYRELLTAIGRTDAVLGPTDDGGFWTIGLRRCPERLLADLPWSAPDTFVRARDRLADLRPAVISGWWDVDVAEDLERLRRDVPRDRAPATWDALDRLAR
jgi:rSAM/selenodomain-associated transferase 1